MQLFINSLKISSILLQQARLALCEAIAALLLNQTKLPPPATALSETTVASTIKTEAANCTTVVDDKIQTIESAISEVAATPRKMRPKTLLELAQGEFDLLDESVSSNSALENTHIEIECTAAETPPKLTASVSFTQMHLQNKRVLQTFPYISIFRD
jgi:hypothetical protein